MPFYDESGKAIITPRTRKKYQEKEETTKPKTTTTRKVSSITTARRKKIAATQEFEATGGTPATHEDLMPLTQQDIKTDISRIQVDVVRTPFVSPTEKAKAVMELQKTKQQISSYPEGTTFKPTAEGYDVIIPETAQLDWSKHYLKKTEKLPPGIQQVAETGFFLTSTMMGIPKAAATLFGKGKEFDRLSSVAMSTAFHIPGLDSKGVVKSTITGIKKGKYGVHYPSMWDYGLEPFGLAPKGSSDLLKKYPIGSTVGGLGGEAAQVIGFSAAFKAGSSAIKVGTKGIVRSTPKIYYKMASEFPSAFSKRLTTTGIKITTPSQAARISQKIGQTAFSKNIYGWAAKGWKPGRILVEHTSPRIVTKGGMEFKTTVFKPDKSVSFLKRRIWMTADDIARYNQRLASSGKIDIMFPRADITAGVGKTTGVVDVTIWKPKGFLGKRLTRTYGSSVFERSVGKKFNIPYAMTYDDIAAKGYGGFTRKLSPFIEKVGKQDDWYSFVKGYYGTPKQAYLRPGSIISKKWHLVALGEKKLMPSFWKSTRGTASIVSKPSLRQTYRVGLGSLSRKASTRGLRMVVPTSAFLSTSLIGPSLMISTRTATGYISSMDIQKRLQIPSLESRQKPVYARLPISESIQSSDTIRIPVQDTLKIPLLQNLTASLSASDVLLSTKTIKAPLQTRTHGITFPKFMPHMTTTTKIKAMPFHFPESYKSKKKKQVNPFKKWSSGYRFRKWEVPTMEDMFDFPTIKKMKKGLKF